MTDAQKPIDRFEECVKAAIERLKSLFTIKPRYTSPLWAFGNVIKQQFRPLFDELAAENEKQKQRMNAAVAVRVETIELQQATIAELEETRKDKVSALSFLLGEHTATITKQAEEIGRLREDLLHYGWHATTCPHFTMSQQDTAADRDNFSMECECGYGAVAYNAKDKTAALAEQPGGKEEG